MTVAAKRVAPVLPVRSVTRALDHYRKLGFSADAYGEKSGDEPIYAFVSAGPVELHLALVPDLEPNANTSACYLYVADANATFESWKSAGVGGRLDEPRDQPYGLREFIHLDPDNNLLRVGSEIAK
jgi:predicted enzyme related to lactoylglutathione lyase